MPRKMAAKRSGRMFIVLETNKQSTRDPNDPPQTTDMIRISTTLHPCNRTREAALRIISKRRNELMSRKTNVFDKPYVRSKTHDQLIRVQHDGYTFTSIVTFDLLTVTRIENLGAG
jgi:hypothetical protein